MDAAGIAIAAVYRSLDEEGPLARYGYSTGDISLKQIVVILGIEKALIGRESLNFNQIIGRCDALSDRLDIGYFRHERNLPLSDGVLSDGGRDDSQVANLLHGLADLRDTGQQLTESPKADRLGQHYIGAAGYLFGNFVGNIP